MPFNGTLRRVTDKPKGWSLLIDTDDKGIVWFSAWDKKLAGQESSQNEIVCDFHDFVGQRVRFEATRGSLKDKDGPEDGERFNATITSIALEAGGPEKTVREMAAEMSSDGQQPTQAPDEAEVPVDVGKDDLRGLTMKMLNAIGEWAQAIEKRGES